MEREIFTMTVGSRVYFGAVAADGWPTGPCPSEAKALLRVEAYERGEEVSEAAPGQCSRWQMTAFAAWAAKERLDVEVEQATQARAAGLHSEAWCIASASFIRLWEFMPDAVRRAGGARLRCAVGEASLARGPAT